MGIKKALHYEVLFLYQQNSAVFFRRSFGCDLREDGRLSGYPDTLCIRAFIRAERSPRGNEQYPESFVP